MKPFLRYFIFFTVLFFGLIDLSSAKRLALVIGNDNYVNVTKLQKAGNDASAMAVEFRKAGYEVTVQKNLNYFSMLKVVDEFANKISGGDEVIVFYAGHGVQLKSGNYILPIDIDPDSESRVEKTAYSLGDLSDKLNEAKPNFTLMIVDACRNNPLSSNKRSIGATRGLSPIEPPKGQMIVFSASKGQEALDRLSESDPNPNSVFTREFISRMGRPGVTIEQLVREVQDAVEDIAKKIGHDQRPALHNEARGNFYFFGPTNVQATPSQANLNTASITPEQREDSFWNDTKLAGNKEAFQAYLSKYPNGNYAALANANITRLKNSEPTVSSIPSGTTQSLVTRQTQPTTQSLTSSQSQSIPLGSIFSDDCDLKFMHARKFAVSWDKVGNELFEKTYYFFDESISIDKVQGEIDERGKGLFNRTDRNASTTYQFVNDSVKLISRVVDGRPSIVDGSQVWDKAPTKTAFRCAPDSYMAKQFTQLNLKSCPDKDSPNYKYAQCFGVLDIWKGDQLYIGNLLAGRESGWGIMYFPKTGERRAGIWTSRPDGSFFQGLQYDGAGKLFNLVKAPVDNFVGVKKSDLGLNDIPKELRFNFALPKCSKINFPKDSSPTSSDKNPCLGIEKGLDLYLIGEFNNGVLNGKMLYLEVSGAKTVESLTFLNGSPRGILRGDNLDPTNFQGYMQDFKKSRIGDFRLQTSKKSIALGKWSIDGKYADVCIYGGDDGFEDIGGGQQSGKCYTKLENFN